MTARRKTLSILLIPEGEKKTFSLKIRYAFLKFMFVGFVFSCVVLIVGAISYWHLTKLSWDYDRLTETNRTLLEQNKIINEIAQKFLAIQETDKRIRNIFGAIEFPDVDAARSSGQFTANNKNRFVTPRSRESLNLSVNPYLRADILSAYPTLKPVEGEITQYFYPHEGLTGGGHFGVDLSAKEGSVVSVAGDGIVAFADWTVESGNLVIIDHQNGYISIYKHNAAILVVKRKFVYRGEAIALLGSSGHSSAPHLHFEIWKHYVPIDPLTLWHIN